MKHDLSNARIIEWDSDGWPSVGARAERGDVFVTTNGHHDTLTEAEAFGLGARVVAEFPVRSLAEIVGDAPAFQANILDPRPGEEHLTGVFAYRHRSGDWRVVSESDGCPWSMVYTLDTLERGILDLSSVVPLFPREVSS